MNWTIWAVAVLVVIGVLGGVTAKPTASGGHRTASPSVSASLPSGTPTTRSTLTTSSHPTPAASKAPAPRPVIKASAPRPVFKASAPRPVIKAPAPPPSTAPAPPRVSPLTCSASMSNPNPADYTTTDVIVHTGVAGAAVTATAHYRTTDTTHSSTAASNGVADIAFRISRATPGYTVRVDVTVSAQGASRSCSTAFTPY